MYDERVPNTHSADDRCIYVLWGQSRRNEERQIWSGCSLGGVHLIGNCYVFSDQALTKDAIACQSQLSTALRIEPRYAHACTIYLSVLKNGPLSDLVVH